MWASAFMVLVVLALALAAACGDDDDDGAQPAAATAPGAEPAPAAPAGQKTGIVKIGVIAPNAGIYEAFGHTYHTASSLVEDEVNNGRDYCVNVVKLCEPGGGILVGDTLYKLEFHKRDDRSDINAAVAAAQELVRDVGVKFCFCGTPHDFAIAISKIVNPAKVIMFSGSSTLEEQLSSERTKLGGPEHYTFQSETREWQRSGSVAKGAIELIDPNSKISVILIQNDATGQFLSDFYKRALESEGQTVPEVIFWPPETTDFNPFLVRAKAHNPDIIHFWYNPDKEMIALAQGIELNAAKSGYFMFAIDPGQCLRECPRTDLPVAASCPPICWGATVRQEAKDYWVRYQAFIGGELRPFSAVSLLTYDHYYMLFRAWKEAGTVTDTDAIVDRLVNNPFHGVVDDNFTYDDNHIVTHATEVCVTEGPADNRTARCTFTLPTVAPPGTPSFE